MEMYEALKAGQKVEVCSEEGLQKVLPYRRCRYKCLVKSTFNRLVLRGRDEVERAFEECRVSSGGHKGRDILQCTCMDCICT